MHGGVAEGTRYSKIFFMEKSAEVPPFWIHVTGRSVGISGARALANPARGCACVNAAGATPPIREQGGVCRRDR